MSSTAFDISKQLHKGRQILETVADLLQIVVDHYEDCYETAIDKVVDGEDRFMEVGVLADVLVSHLEYTRDLIDSCSGMESDMMSAYSGKEGK